MKLTAIAAVAANGVIGGGGGMVWNIPEDFARFKRVTMGQILIMGRVTFDSIGKGLPGRTSIVISRSPRPADLPEIGKPAANGQPTRVLWANSLDEALAQAQQLQDEAAATSPNPSLRGASASERRGNPCLETVGASRSVDDGLLRQNDVRGDSPQVFIGGGAHVYAEAWDRLTDLDITEIHAEYDGDARFPTIDPAQWRETSRDPRDGFDFVTYKRIGNPETLEEEENAG